MNVFCLFVYFFRVFLNNHLNICIGQYNSDQVRVVCLFKFLDVQFKKQKQLHVYITEELVTPWHVILFAI